MNKPKNHGSKESPSENHIGDLSGLEPWAPWVGVDMAKPLVPS